MPRRIAAMLASPAPAPLHDAAATLERLRAALAVEAARPESAAGMSGIIGQTPCVALRRIDASPRRAEVLAKLEMLSPGGSIKDRTAFGMVLDAEARGVLRPGMRLVEATAGNTGIGLALVARSRGYEVSLVMPERYATEKARLCAVLGAQVVRVAGESAGMRECLDEARRLAGEGGLLLNQFENPANPAIHELTTGPEIARQCGRADAVVIGVGTGGTLSGVGRFLKRFQPDIEMIGVEAEGSVIGGGTFRRSRVEGIGNSFVPATLDLSLMSSIVTVSDADAFATARRLAREEGILAGPSGGAIVFAALCVARRLGPGRRVVTLIPDGAERYWSKDLFEGA